MSPEKPQQFDNRGNSASTQDPISEAPPVPPPMSDRERKLAGVKRMREWMKSAKVKGNPKDYCLVTSNKHIIDWERAHEVQASLPDKIGIGNHVWHHARNGRLRPVEIVREDDELWVKNEVAEWKVTRDEIYPTGLPVQMTVLHKSELRKLVGDRVAALFWNHRLHMRVSQR